MSSRTRHVLSVFSKLLIVRGAGPLVVPPFQQRRHGFDEDIHSNVLYVASVANLSDVEFVKCVCGLCLAIWNISETDIRHPRDTVSSALFTSPSVVVVSSIPKKKKTNEVQKMLHSSSFLSEGTCRICVGQDGCELARERHKHLDVLTPTMTHCDVDASLRATIW